MSKKRKGKKDAWLLTEMDSMHIFMLDLMGERTSNEAVCNFDVDMTALDAFLAEKNSHNPEFKYTIFHAVCAAFFRTVELRPSMNWFIRNGRYWERKEISISAIAKKAKKDGAEEGLIILRDRNDVEKSTLDLCHDDVCRQANVIRETKEGGDDTMNTVNTLLKLPKFIYKAVMSTIRRLDRTGKLPADLAKSSPYCSTVFITNLGSIKMNASYHHLINFGTNSLFMVIGSKTKKPVFHEDGTFELRDMLPIGFTIDERIADGVYFANSLKILKALLLKPQFLDIPANQPIDKDALLEGLDL